MTPTRPSPHDLHSVIRTVEMAERLGKPQVFVVNAASSHARITVDMAIELSQHGTLAPSIIHQRSDFASSMIDGRTVMEIPRKSNSADEIRRLWNYLEDRLDRLRRKALESSADTYVYRPFRPEEPEKQVL